MSHLTKTRTHFKNLSYLEKSLAKLEIPNFNSKSLTDTNDLVLSKTKNNDLSFNWNGQFFELNVDYDYWNQGYSLSHFLTRIKKEYATETIVGESQNFGFVPVQYTQTEKGRIISLQRFNTYQ
jgi:hypothetical protein